MHSLCKSSLRHAFPSLRCTLRIFAVPSLFFIRPCLSYLCYAFASRRQSPRSLSFAKQLFAFRGYSFAQLRNAMQFLCIAVPAALFLCCSKLCSAFAILLEAKPFHRCAFPLPFHASPSLLFFMPRLAFPLLLLAYQFLSFAGQFTAVMFRCKSLYCSAKPLQIKS